MHLKSGALAVLVAVASALTGYSLAADGVAFPLPAPPHSRPDILLVTVDALRADHVSSYGYARLTSPALDAFAGRAIRFETAIAQAPYTKASVASIMTGLLPSTHKTVTASVPFPETMTGHPTTAPVATDVLPSTATTLAKMLHLVGYSTVAFTANPFLIEPFGFAQGFDRFTFYPGGDFAGGDRLVADAVEAVRGADRRRPLFLWVHLMEPHSPYTPPAWTAGMFTVRGAPDPIPAHVDIPSWLLPGSPRDRRRYLAAYDDEIAAADAEVDTLVRDVCELRPADGVAVIATADHGEQFLDHGGWEHGSNLHDELIRVPLMMKLPGVSPRVVSTPVQLVDLMPTIAELADAALPAGLPGRSLLPIAEHAGDAEPAFSEIVGSQYAIRDRGFKLIAFNDGRVELYDLAGDPGERHDVAAEQPVRVERMRAMLDRALARAIERGREIHGESVAIEPEIADRLRALGYLQR